jgi:coenzyme F420-reducing hydrogenase alpha subunit
VEAFSLRGQTLWLGSGKKFPVADYHKLLAEESCTESYAKHSCSADGPLLVGALARARLAKERGLVYEPKLEQEGIYANNNAQLSEIGWALGRARDLVELLQNTSDAEPLLTKVDTPEGGVGTAVMEAPRGLLVHQYVIDEWGYVAAADVVTPTAINQRTMKEQILADLAGETDAKQMRLVAEQIIRAFDPCISCAVHLLEI